MWDKLEEIPILKKGGIHIKKKNRGKFTEWCGGKVTQECINRGKNSKNPKIRKKATFADNARRWKHQMGGTLINPQQIIDMVNNSGAYFVQRLLDPNRKYIKDWKDQNRIATHKLGWATDDHGAFVYPEVQELNGSLYDFTMLPYRQNAAIDQAIENNNIVRMSPEEAQWFTTNYKKYYPFK